MKKLLIVVLVITLPLITFFQYQNYRRFNPPTSYDYQISDGIDANYHDYSLVEEYYTKAVDVSAFARLKWRNDKIDVLFPDQSLVEEMNAAKRYNQMISRLTALQALLEKSAEYKSAGFTNEEIKLIEAGIPSRVAKLVNQGSGTFELYFGDKGQSVWLLQKKLIEKGYDHKLDGVFGYDTQSAITNFQKDASLYPSGRLDNITFFHLFAD